MIEYKELKSLYKDLFYPSFIMLSFSPYALYMVRIDCNSIQVSFFLKVWANSISSQVELVEVVNIDDYFWDYLAFFL